MTTTEATAPLTEDTAFRYAGYARSTVSRLQVGDGVRFHAGPFACLLVETVEHTATHTHLVLTDRAASVAGIVADTLHVPVEGMAADPNLQAATFENDWVCWIRL